MASGVTTKCAKAAPSRNMKRRGDEERQEGALFGLVEPGATKRQIW